MPEGKRAGERCIHLTPENLCSLFGDPRRPEVCRSLRPNREMCGSNQNEALEFLVKLERATARFL
jgi:hypothetical protein